MTADVQRRNDGAAWEEYWRRGVSGSVFGVDISPAAVAKSRREHVLANVDYEQLDATDIAGARRLHAQLGDANLHLRGVRHAITAADWPAVLATLAVLAGEHGQVFDIEISPEFSEVRAQYLARFVPGPLWRPAEQCARRRPQRIGNRETGVAGGAVPGRRLAGAGFRRAEQGL